MPDNPADKIHPNGIVLHWNPDLTCGDCIHRKRVRQEGEERTYSRCMLPLEIGGKVIYRYARKSEIYKYQRACPSLIGVMEASQFLRL